jgi:hypothetical protein
MEQHHGSRTRGLSRGRATVPQGPLFEGRFGRMFRRLPVFEVDENDLRNLADSMTQTEPVDNLNIPSGFTYLGQFVDHDITFDPNSSLQRMNDPEALVNFRTPRFDLDSLYGRGPVETPFLYDQADPDKVKLLVGRVINDNGEREENQHDLPRNVFREPTDPQQRALIGDPRNDENAFVSQLHLLFIKFHNRVVNKVRNEQPQFTGDDLFKEAQRIVRWHYQWVVVFDFLARTVPEGMLDKLLVRDEEGLRSVELRWPTSPSSRVRRRTDLETSEVCRSPRQLKRRCWREHAARTCSVRTQPSRSGAARFPASSRRWTSHLKRRRPSSD